MLYDYNNADRVYSVEDDEDKIKKLLLYRKIVKVDGDTLYLDNGTELQIYPNSGCGGCPSGNYELIELNKCDNVITNVELIADDIDEADGDYDGYDGISYKIYVFTEDTRIKVLQVDGTDGNGYYGTGYEIAVKFSKSTKYEDLPEELKDLVELGIYTEEDAILQYVTTE